MKSNTVFRTDSLFVFRAVSAVIVFVSLVALTSAPAVAQKVFSAPASYASAAIDASGNLWVWSYDQYTHVGTSTAAPPSGTVPKDSTPVMVAFPSGVTAWTTVATGQTHVVALGNDGNLYSWGFNNDGQLGDSTTTNEATPVMVHKPTGVTGWTAVACGAFHNVAIDNSGNVYAWGLNSQGQLGDSSLTNKIAPTEVTLPTTVTAVSATNNTCMALGSDGKIYAWGKNGNGQLGDSTTIDHYSTIGTVHIPVGVTVASIASGNFFNTCLGTDGNIYAWGQGNNGQIGNGSTSPSNVLAVTVANKPSGVTSWKKYACGASFVLAIANNDTLYGWGFGGTGELGNGSTTSNNTTPVKVSLAGGVTAVNVAGGHNHGFIVDQNNNVYAWGRNIEGETGSNTTVSPKTTPVQVVGLGGTGNLVLPVEMTSFSAETQSNTVVLDWQTKTEVNNAGFNVLRQDPNSSSYKLIASYSTTVSLKGMGFSSSGRKYIFTDTDVHTASTYSYKIQSVSSDGITKDYSPISVTVDVPKSFTVGQNYPNPFNPSTTISYDIPTTGKVVLKIYDILGQQVRTLVDEIQAPGSYKAVWNGDTNSGEKVGSGVYFYDVTFQNGTRFVKKMTLMK
ncbi:MAG TPA: T9SS type A sorting domain-containing protein [Bacteroidota bacterium]|nr:T9SS type A sorting domain-containing protein [Bacteroidota bacterium]